jgi:hypothetical protein
MAASVIKQLISEREKAGEIPAFIQSPDLLLAVPGTILAFAFPQLLVQYFDVTIRFFFKFGFAIRTAEVIALPLIIRE